MTMRNFLTIAVISLVLAHPTPVHAQSADPDALGAEARHHLDAGLAHHQAGDYEAALEEFRAGYQSEPSPLFLFAMAQAERLSGDCPSAVVYYQEFLTTGPAARHAAVARSLLEQCRSALASQPEDGPAPAPTRSAPPPVERPLAGSPLVATPRVDNASWYRDRTGATLLGLGFASAGLGLGFYLAARSETHSADTADSYQEFAGHAATARRDQRIALVGGVAATALLTAWTIRHLRRAHRSRTFSAAIGPGLVQATLRVAF